MRKNFLTIGHSNMCDRGWTNELPTFANASSMFVYQEDPHWINQSGWVANTQGIWAQATAIVEPMGSVAGNAGALQLAFANKLAGYTGTEIGLVPHAEGGALIDYFNPSVFNRNNGEYGMALQRMIWAEAQGTTSGIVIWLGENDADTSAHANAFCQKYGDIIRALRSDLGNPYLPVVIVKPGDESHPERPYWSTMRQQIDWMEQTKRNFKIVNTDDISPIAGDVHFTTANYILIGERIADVMSSML